jgi:RNA polymerase sigma-70 factor (ECF subfamily)
MAPRAVYLPFQFRFMQAGEPRQPDVHDQPNPIAWVDEHGDYLLHYAAVRLRDKGVAEDVVQETLLSAIESLNTYHGKASERTWLTSILKHKIVDFYRRSIRETPIGEAECDISAFDSVFTHPQWADHWNDAMIPADWGSTPETMLQETEFYSTLETCMSKLPKRVAGLFMLREMEGYDTRELCQLLDLSANNLWTMMYRARMSLRKCIELNWFEKHTIH